MPELLALSEVIANRAWLRIESPFPYVVARDVFTPAFYNALESQLQAILDQGLSDADGSAGIRRTIPGYDAYGMGLDESAPAPIGLFVSEAWRDLMCSLFDVGPTPYVFAGVHHHPIGSRDGFIHNDFNPVWFPRANGSRALQSPDQAVCAYKTGAGSLDEAQKAEVVRGAVMIFFLLNDGWQPGHGGETGLFDTRDADVSNAVTRCAPENNSLIMFECTPRSFHTYLGRNRNPRTSVIMWVHRTLEEAISKYGEARLERWVL
jgi:2OG-Fe(II) oxygenase superfamily